MAWFDIDADKLGESAAQIALAAFGGLIGAAMRKEASSWQSASLGALGAGFVGLLVAKLCHGMGVSDDITFVLVGISGWLGASRTIDYLERLIEGRLGIALPRATAQNSSEKSNDSNSYNQSAVDDAKVKETPPDSQEYR